MKRLLFSLAILVIASFACGVFTIPTPEFGIPAVETLDVGIATILAPTQSPPTLIPVSTVAVMPSATAVPTQTPVPPPPPSNSPTRIQFAAGAISATVNGTVVFPNRPQYVLYAFKNQRMTVQISSADHSANFAILGVTDSQPLKRFENEDRTWTGYLPTTQDYILQVAVPSGSANYSLTVTIVWP